MNQKECLDNVYDEYDIRFGDKAFKYYLYDGRLKDSIDHLYVLKDIESFVIISDSKVGSLYGQTIAGIIQDRYKCDLVMFECTEKHKNLRNLEELIETVLSLKVTRRTCVIGLGGGICGNMAGMVAALLFRGIRFIHIPTSLMAVLDSVLSLKQAINSNYGKNLIGVFHTPEMVVTNTEFLKSLSKGEVISGICEVIKNALAILPQSIEKLSMILNPECNYTTQDFRYFIDMSIRAKTVVMKNDPFEKKDALILEYGHTIGHAIELSDAGKISHGEAIGLGMLCAAEISHALGHLPEEDIRLHKELLEKAGAAARIPSHIRPETILSIMKFDNKRGYVDSEGGIFHMVLLEGTGKPLRHKDTLITPVPEETAKEAIIKMYV